MTTPQDQFVDFAQRSQEAVTTAVRTWTDTLNSVAGSLSGEHPTLPSAHVWVDNVFDFAQQLLTNQRELTKTLLLAGAQAAENVTDQAAKATETVTANAVNATRTATEKVSEATKAAGDQATSTARAARNTAKN